MSTLLPDTGARTAFDTGAVRDASENKGFPHMIPSIAIKKIAVRFEQGAIKYSRNNWMKGIPLSRYQDAIMRHLGAWAEGLTDEDHLGAVGWNMAAAAWTEEAINKGILPRSLNDLPFRPENLPGASAPVLADPVRPEKAPGSDVGFPGVDDHLRACGYKKKAEVAQPTPNQVTLSSEG